MLARRKAKCRKSQIPWQAVPSPNVGCGFSGPRNNLYADANCGDPKTRQLNILVFAGGRSDYATHNSCSPYCLCSVFEDYFMGKDVIHNSPATRGCLEA